MTNQTSRSESSSFRRFLVPALIAGLVLSLALGGTFGFLWLKSVDTSTEEVSTYLSEEAPEVANTAAEVATLLINYDSTNIEQRQEEVVPLSIGRFREQYEDLLSQGLGAALEKTAASSRGQILQGPDISFVSASEATAILQTTQTVQSKDNVGGRTFSYVMQLSLIRTPEGAWKVNLFKILSQQES
jgi:hypothetical protein